MSYNTLDSRHLFREPHRETLSRHSTSLAGRPKTSSFGIPIITNTVSSNFFKPQKIPLACQERQQNSTTAKPFFTKVRKFTGPRNARGTLIPTTFKNMLRAKSTVIKKNKCQEFYLNREGRQAELDQLQLSQFGSIMKSNLFRSNFPQKRAKRASVYFEKGLDVRCESNHIIRTNELHNGVGKMMTIQAATEDVNDMALQERQFCQNNLKTSKQGNNTPKMKWRSWRKKQKVDQKENMEYQICPWGALDSEEMGF